MNRSGLLATLGVAALVGAVSVLTGLQTRSVLIGGVFAVTNAAAFLSIAHLLSGLFRGSAGAILVSTKLLFTMLATVIVVRATGANAFGFLLGFLPFVVGVTVAGLRTDAGSTPTLAGNA